MSRDERTDVVRVGATRDQRTDVVRVGVGIGPHEAQPATATGRTVFGLAVPYNVEIPVFNHRSEIYYEQFQRGAFRTSRPPIPLLFHHKRDEPPAGTVTRLTETARGLEFEAKVSKTRAGDELLELIADHAIRSVSVGFQSLDPPPLTEKAGALVVRRHVRLTELSLIATGLAAYQDAVVEGVRAPKQYTPAERQKILADIKQGVGGLGPAERAARLRRLGIPPRAAELGARLRRLGI